MLYGKVAYPTVFYYNPKNYIQFTWKRQWNEIEMGFEPKMLSTLVPHPDMQWSLFTIKDITQKSKIEKQRHLSRDCTTTTNYPRNAPKPWHCTTTSAATTYPFQEEEIIIRGPNHRSSIVHQMSARNGFENSSALLNCSNIGQSKHQCHEQFFILVLQVIHRIDHSKKKKNYSPHSRKRSLCNQGIREM